MKTTWRRKTADQDEWKELLRQIKIRKEEEGLINLKNAL